MFKINLDYDQADAIIVESLLDSYSTLNKFIDELLEKQFTRKLKDFEVQDLADHVFNATGIKIALSYYMVADEFEEQFGEKHPLSVNDLSNDFSYMKEAVPELREWEYDGGGMAVWNGTRIPYNIKN